MTRALSLLLSLLLALLAQGGPLQGQLPGGAAPGAGAPACTGRNVLDELARTDAAAYARILAAAEATENGGAILWRIERAGIEPSHLLGTMHLSDARIAALPAAAAAALHSARRLVLEIADLEAGGLADAFQKARELMMLAGGRRLDHMLGEEEFRKLAEVLQRLGMRSQAVAMFRPWVPSLLLALSDCERLRVARGELPLDLRLARAAKERGIAVAGLETVELQLRAMAQVPEADQVEILKAGLRNYDRIDDLIETTVQLYLGRRLGAVWPLQLALAEKVGVAARAFDSAEHNLLVARNLRMRDKALPHLADGGVMIAVGALHLPGRHGLVALLRAAGYEVTAVE